jgi:phosphoserine phosphatase
MNTRPLTHSVSPPRPLILITVSGQDAPGITSELTGILALAQAQIQDIGQAVIHGLLSLSILFDLPPEEGTSAGSVPPVLKDLLFKSVELGLKLEYKLLPHTRPATPPSHRYAITLLADQIPAAALHQVTHSLAQSRFNIDLIQRLSEDEFSCVEMIVATQNDRDEPELKKKLLAIAREQGVDIALQREGLFRRSKRLVVFDLDSTLIQCEVIDEFAREMGVFDQVAAITEEAMNGKLDFDESLRRRVEKLKGLSPQQIQGVYERIRLTPGAENLIQTLKKLGYQTAIISGGFTTIAEKLGARLGIDRVFANQLEFGADGNATGKVALPIVNAQRKADLLEQLARETSLNPEQVIAIGDGANDLLMLERAGLGIAFNAKPVVREKADTSLNTKGLDAILHLLGISKRDL